MSGPISPWVNMKNYSPVSEMRKGRRRVVARNSRNKANMAKHKVITFAPIIALATLIAVSLLSNGMLMMWKIQQAKQDDAEFIRRIHPAFIPVTGLKCSYSKFSSPLTEILVGKTEISESSQPALSYEHIENFTKDLEVRRDLGNRASPVNRTHVKRPLDG